MKRFAYLLWLLPLGACEKEKVEPAYVLPPTTTTPTLPQPCPTGQIPPCDCPPQNPNPVFTPIFGG